MDKYSETIIESARTYIENLQYVGKHDQKLLNDIYDLMILNHLLDWACTYDIDYQYEIILKRWMDKIINANPLLYKWPFVATGYSNVNTPQTMYTWDSLDNSFSTTILQVITNFGDVEAKLTNTKKLIEKGSTYTTYLQDYEGELINSDRISIIHGVVPVTNASYNKDNGLITIDNVQHNIKINVI